MLIFSHHQYFYPIKEEVYTHNPIPKLKRIGKKHIRKCQETVFANYFTLNYIESIYQVLLENEDYLSLLIIYEECDLLKWPFVRDIRIDQHLLMTP